MLLKIKNLGSTSFLFLFLYFCASSNGQMLDGSKCQMAKHDLFSFPLVCKHPTWLDWKKHCFFLSFVFKKRRVG